MPLGQPRLGRFDVRSDVFDGCGQLRRALGVFFQDGFQRTAVLALQPVELVQSGFHRFQPPLVDFDGLEVGAQTLHHVFDAVDDLRAGFRRGGERGSMRPIFARLRRTSASRSTAYLYSL